MRKQQEPLIEAITQSGRPLLGPLIRQAFRWYQDSVTAGLVARGERTLTITQFEIFARVDEDGITIAELARRMGITRQSAHQAVGELVRADLLRVDRDPSSVRNKLVRPTPHAMARLRIVGEVLLDVEEKLAAQLGAGKVEELRQILASEWGAPPEN
jgi:DNA-binding MarR family transcriptional regulator